MTRVIVTGFGFMGQPHAASWLKTPDAELTAIVDPKERLKTITGNCAPELISPEMTGSTPHFRRWK